MRYRKLIATGLVLGLLALCGLIVLIAGLSFSQVTRWVGRWGNWASVSAESAEEQRFPVDTPALLTIANTFGNVTVTTAETDEIVVSVTKIGWGLTQAEAEAARDALKVTFTQTGDTLVIRVEEPRQIEVFDAERSASADFTVTVPVETAVNLDTLSGRVTLRGTTGAADLETDFGSILVTNLTGALTAHTSSGEITARDIRAGLEAITLTSDFGTVRLENASGASASLDSSSGKLVLIDVSLTGKVVADTDFGTVITENVAASAYDLRTSSGDIEVTNVSGPLKAKTDFGSISVTQAVSTTLDLKTSSGNITFAGSLGAGPHQARTDFGQVTLRLPTETALDVDLQTDFGSINTDFAITVSGNVNDDNTHLVGPINGGGETLDAESSSGSIRLEILEP